MAAVGPLLMIVATWGSGSTPVTSPSSPSRWCSASWAPCLVRRQQTAAKVVALVLAVIVGGAVFWTVVRPVHAGQLLRLHARRPRAPWRAARARRRDRVDPRARAARSGTGSGEPSPSSSAVLGPPRRRCRPCSPSPGATPWTMTLAADADLVVDLEDFEFDQATYDVARRCDGAGEELGPVRAHLHRRRARHRRRPRARSARSSSRCPTSPAPTCCSASRTRRTRTTRATRTWPPSSRSAEPPKRRWRSAASARERRRGGLGG